MSLSPPDMPVHTPERKVEDGGDSWFCERGNFWGTINQLLLCAKCGKNEFKRHDQPRHYFGLCSPGLHMVCDECFDALPDDAPDPRP